MRIRNILTLAFLFATLVPSVLYGWWSYNQGVEREFSEVKDRHLLIAQNLSGALDRYYVDLVAAFDSISTSMLFEQELPKMHQLMRRLNMICVLVVDNGDGRILARAEIEPGRAVDNLPAPLLEKARAIAVSNQTKFSAVMEGPSGQNEILAVHRYGDRLAVARIGTSYFISVAKAVAFGEKGHAAIVDHEGNVMAHPLPEWVASRKNIAKVSAVQRMMNGETGIERFYSPAMKGDMIAGLTTVEGPGWGVMVPQPVSEIYEKVFDNNITILAVLVAGVSLTFLLVWLLIRALASPLEEMVEALRENARSRTLRRTSVRFGFPPIAEMKEYEDSYNHMVDQVSDAHHEIRRLAYTDGVTGLPNREKFRRLARDLMTRTTEAGTGGVLVFIDIDNFKEINDIHGHEVGDAFLNACAAKLTEVSGRLGARLEHEGKAPHGAEPIVARIGGDEFTVIVPGLEGEAAILAFLSELREELSHPSEEMGFISHCSASIGCARFPQDAATVEELIKRADLAMYHGKNRGKDKIQMYGPELGTRTRAELRRDVLQAIEKDELVLEYQPKISTSGGAPDGVEALVRWNHPELGRLAPDLWLPAINDSPVVARLGEWVIRRAMADSQTWAAKGHSLKVSVNVASKHFANPGFVDWIETAVKEARFDPAMMEIEITEDALLWSLDRAERALNRLHEIGFSISIDDFGKGYSNIARLARLPVDHLKIDRSIVAGAQESERLYAIMSCIIAMARQLGCQTVAEGVETLQQAEFATKLGADVLQGYYFSGSLPPEALLAWLERTRTNAVHDYQAALATG